MKKSIENPLILELSKSEDWPLWLIHEQLEEFAAEVQTGGRDPISLFEEMFAVEAADFMEHAFIYLQSPQLDEL